MNPEAAQKGRKRTTMQVRTEAWSVLLVMEAETDATVGGGVKPGRVYEDHFIVHLDRKSFFARLGMLRAEGFFYLDGKQKSPETSYYFHKGREKAHRRLRDKWFPKGEMAWPTGSAASPFLPFIQPAMREKVLDIALGSSPGPRTAGEITGLFEAPGPPRGGEYVEAQAAYKVPDSTLRATYFSCPACGGQDLEVKHRLDPKELSHLFEVKCHSAFLVQCCTHPLADFFLIAFGENSLRQQVVKVLLPGEW